LSPYGLVRELGHVQAGGGGRSVEKLRSTRGRKQCIYGGTAKLFLLFLSILWWPAPKPPVLTSFEGNVILTVYFER